LLNWHCSVGGRNENDDIFNDPDKNLSKMHLKISVFLFYNKFPCRSKICVCVFFEWTQINMERDWEGMLAEQKLTTTHRFDICFVNADTKLVKSQYNYECNYTILPFCLEIIRSVLLCESPLIWLFWHMCDMLITIVGLVRFSRLWFFGHFDLVHEKILVLQEVVKAFMRRIKWFLSFLCIVLPLVQ